MKSKQTYLFLILFFLLLQACNHNDCGCVTPPQSGYSFFYPIYKQYVEYEVEETQYALSQEPLVKTYQVKELVDSFFTDIDGKEALLIKRFQRNNEQQAWKLDSVFTSKKLQDKALKSENNITYLKLMFPLKEKMTWDINLFNAFGKDEVVVENLYKPYTVNNQYFPSTVRIVQENDSTLVDLKKKIEIYADGVGLIYAEKTALAYCNTPDCIGKNKVDFGTRFIMKFKKNGKE